MTHRPNYKLNSAGVLLYMSRSERDRAAQREALHWQRVATWLCVGIAGTFIAIIFAL